MSASTASAPSAPSPTGPSSSPISAIAEPASGASPTPTGSSPEAQVYAIVEASGQQFWLQPNRYLDIDRLEAEVGSLLTLDTVLLVNGSNGATLGQPYVSGATVDLKVMTHRRGPKILVYKMRCKKKTRRKAGHRQELTRVMVTAIHLAGNPVS
jgi:large subunit ribosomal protein L21